MGHDEEAAAAMQGVREGDRTITLSKSRVHQRTQRKGRAAGSNCHAETGTHHRVLRDDGIKDRTNTLCLKC